MYREKYNNMKKLITIVILTAYTCLPAFSQNTEYSRSGKDDVWFEVRNDTANPCRYTEDNKIYQAEREFTFGFHYYDPQGKERYMRYERIPKQGYELTETGDTSTYTYYVADFSFSDVFDAKDSCINRYEVEVLCTAKPFSKDYNQTVKAVAKSRIGKTYLTAYYNDIYGFVKMDNTNIDGSRIVIDFIASFIVFHPFFTSFTTTFPSVTTNRTSYPSNGKP